MMDVKSRSYMQTERVPIEVDRKNVFIYFYKDDGALSTGVVNIEFNDGIYKYYGDKKGGYSGRRRNKSIFGFLVMFVLLIEVSISFLM